MEHFCYVSFATTALITYESTQLKTILKVKSTWPPKQRELPTKNKLKQTTIPSSDKSKDQREFILEFIKLCTISDTPLEKTENFWKAL